MAHAGDEIANYRLLRLIGTGGMASVFLAEDTVLGRQVALKLIQPPSDDTTFRDRFLRESRLAAQLDHPNIVPVYSAGSEGDVYFIAMRHVEGGDLDALLEAPGQAGSPLGTDLTLSILGPVAEALDAAHARGTIHRDVKPPNILLERRADGGYTPFLSDFGVARPIEGTRYTAPGDLLGTPLYVAPEQARGDPVDARTDVYALACVLFRCLTGVPPYVRETSIALVTAHLVEPPPSISALRPDLASLEPVIRQGMAKDPAERTARCSDLVAAARAALDQDRRPAPAPTALLDTAPLPAPTAEREPAPAPVPPAEPETAPVPVAQPELEEEPTRAVPAARPGVRPGAPEPVPPAPAGRRGARLAGAAIVLVVLALAGVLLVRSLSDETGPAAPDGVATVEEADAAIAAFLEAHFEDPERAVQASTGWARRWQETRVMRIRAGRPHEPRPLELEVDTQGVEQVGDGEYAVRGRAHALSSDEGRPFDGEYTEFLLRREPGRGLLVADFTLTTADGRGPILGRLSDQVSHHEETRTNGDVTVEVGPVLRREGAGPQTLNVTLVVRNGSGESLTLPQGGPSWAFRTADGETTSVAEGNAFPGEIPPGESAVVANADKPASWRAGEPAPEGQLRFELGRGSGEPLVFEVATPAFPTDL